MKKICSFSRDSERERKHTSCHYLWEWCWWYSDCDWIGVDEEDDCGNDWVGRRREEVHRTMASLYFLLSVHLFAFYSGLPLSSLHLPLSTSAPSFLHCECELQWDCSVHSAQCTVHSAQCTMYTLFHGISPSLPFCTLYLSQPLYLSTSVPHIYPSLLLCRPFCNTIVHSSAALHCCALHWDYRVFTNVAQCLPLHASTQMHCSTVQWSELIWARWRRLPLFPHFRHIAPLPICNPTHITRRNTFVIF